MCSLFHLASYIQHIFDIHSYCCMYQQLSFVSWTTIAKIPQTGQLKKQILLSNRSGGWEIQSEIKVLVDLVSGEKLLPKLQTAVFLLYMAKIGHLSCVSSYKDTEDTNPTQKDSNHGQTMFQQPQYQEPSHWGLVLQQMNYGGITNIWPIAVVHSFFFFTAEYYFVL